MTQIKVLSVNISEKKGTIKHPVNSIELNSYGVINDAHSGSWHRQVSLLGIESFDKFSKEANRKIAFGEFAENITTEGFELFKMSPLDILKGEKATLMVTQIGKKCHGDNCNIFREVGNCVMPKEGIFAKVISGGTLTANDTFNYIPRKFSFDIITLSDRASKGEYKDLSGPEIERMIVDNYSKSNRKLDINRTIIPDEADLLSQNITNLISSGSDVIITTGGTGLSQRDITPEVIKPMLNKEIPGIMEFIRVKYGATIPSALLSRSVAGTIDKTLVLALPGSVKAVKEYMSEILPLIDHIVYSLNGLERH